MQLKSIFSKTDSSILIKLVRLRQFWKNILFIAFMDSIWHPTGSLNWKNPF